jgi:predicted nucleic acid-binding protein
MPHQKIAEKLFALVASHGILTANRVLITDALKRFHRHSIDYIDCYHAACALQKSQSVVTWDKDFKKFSDIEALPPQKI